MFFKLNILLIIFKICQNAAENFKNEENYEFKLSGEDLLSGKSLLVSKNSKYYDLTIETNGKSSLTDSFLILFIDTKKKPHI